jgi:hypothetical protein
MSYDLSSRFLHSGKIPMRRSEGKNFLAVERQNSVFILQAIDLDQ